MHQDCERSGNRACGSIWARWAVEHSAHRKLIREDSVYRRQYTILVFVPIIYSGLSIVASLMRHRLGLVGGLAYLVLSTGVMFWLVTRESVFLSRRVAAFLRVGPKA